jgi:hypothetical protein
MVRVEHVTDWRIRLLQRDDHLCSYYALKQILERFGHRFRVVDKHRPLAIDRDVLRDVNDMIAGYAVWDPRRREW